MKKQIRKATLRSVALVASIAALSVSAHATGTDTTFDTITNKVSAMLDGSLGVLLGLTGVFVSVFAMASRNWGGVAAGVGVAMTAAFGPDVMTSMFSAII